MIKPENKIQWTYQSATAQEVKERYDQWAPDHDREMREVHGAPKRTLIIQEVVKVLPKEARILDAGVGTGLIGEELYQLGYHNLEGLDISEGMLAEARKKNVYTKLHTGILGEKLNFSDDTFDGIVLSGVFTYGHAPSSSLDELVRITKPGGYLIFTIRPDYYETSDIKEKLATFERNRIWQFVTNEVIFQAAPQSDPDLYLQVWVYKVTD